MANSFQTSSQSGRSRVTTVAPSSDGTIRSVSLLVGGQRIVIRTDQNPEYLQALANEVNELVESLQQASPGTGMPTIMALASIQLADRAFAAEQAVERENIKIERHIERLNCILKNLESDGTQA
ncbi:MAG: cell division protein ZapA [Proteobacteria bacterium]|nr:cell division protein ZapA [Pseudomonadota bacterium]